MPTFFLDGFFQFFFYFRLRLAEDVFDDGLASFRIVTDCVPAFPASILALSDVPSPFARRFGMVSAPFATNNTVIKGTKLSENRTVIRKLSFALFEPRLRIFVYAAQFLRCQGRSSLVTAVRFLDWSRSPFH